MKRIAERSGMAVMGAGILMVCQPWLREAFQWGFLVTLAGIVWFLVATHLPEPRPRLRGGR